MDFGGLLVNIYSTYNLPNCNIADPTHSLHHNKTAKPWIEVYYNKEDVIKLFPKIGESKIQSFTGGVYHLKKAKTLRALFEKKHGDRKEDRLLGPLNTTSTTVGTNAGSNVKVI